MKRALEDQAGAERGGAGRRRELKLELAAFEMRPKWQIL